MLAAGDLKRVVAIKKPGRVPDGMGGYEDGWTDVATVRAAVWPVKASEAIANMRETVTVTHRVRLRYRDDIDETCIIIFRSRELEIKAAINPEERNEYLDLLCEEKK